MKVAVTGGSGFIGSHLVDRLKDEGYEVIVIDHRVRPHRKDVQFEDVDILDVASVISATKGCDYVYHLAAVSNVNYAYKYPVYAVELNIKGTTNILEAARLNGVRRVFFASTVWVYTGTRENGNGKMDEDAPFYLPDAGHIYTSSKITCEMLIHNYWQLYKQPFTILRYGIPYGPRGRDELVIPIFIRKALKGEPIVIQGDGSQYRNYVYIDDLIEAHILASSPKAENQVFNLEGPRRVSIKEIAEAVKSALGGDVRIEFAPGRPGDYKGKEVSADKARKILGWVPQIEFEEGIRRTIDWYREAHAEELGLTKEAAVR
ncbi:MAG: NAD-dependent epimerase/dehydratase family protein [Candidatus Omnitrophica bacterium]|nr:NAD-dependent epimerase/dehydratase family protein [Candidatus Omnitrophota bacterium]